MVRFSVCCKKKIRYYYSACSIFSSRQKMNEKGTQVAIGSKNFLQTSCGTKTPGKAPKKHQATQCGMAKGSCVRDERKPDRKWQ